MAQVERYPTENHHTTLADDPTHPLSSAVPSKPGPDLDSSYNHALPDPPQFVQPHAQEEDFNLSSTNQIEDAPVTHQSLVPDEPLISIQSDHLDPKPLSSEPPVEEEVQSTEAAHVAPIEHLPEPEQVIEPDHLPASTEDLQVEEPAAVQVEPAEEEVVPEPITAPIEEPVVSEVETENALETDVVEDDQKPQLENNTVHTIVTEKKSVEEEKLAVGDDWTDLSKPEVQFALCLFALPWTSLLITSRTVNTLIYLIFDWQLVRPVTGLLLSILAPSLVYTSLVAMFISLFSETLQNY